MQTRQCKGYRRVTARNFLHSFPLSSTPVVQSYWAAESGPFGTPFLTPKIPPKKFMWVRFLRPFPGNKAPKMGCLGWGSVISVHPTARCFGKESAPRGCCFLAEQKSCPHLLSDTARIACALACSLGDGGCTPFMRISLVRAFLFDPGS